MRKKKIWKILIGTAAAAQIAVLPTLSIINNNHEAYGQDNSLEIYDKEEEDSVYENASSDEERNEDQNEVQGEADGSNSIDGDVAVSDSSEDNALEKVEEQENENSESAETNEETDEEEPPDEEEKPDGLSVHAQIEVSLADGTICNLAEQSVPSELECNGISLPADYADGVFKVAVPEGTDSLQIAAHPSFDENETIQMPFFFSGWKGYLWQDETEWKLYPEFLGNEEYVYATDTFDAEVTTWLVDEIDGAAQISLEDFIISEDSFSQEQQQVYGELDFESFSYAEICIGYFDEDGERYENSILLVEIPSENAGKNTVDVAEEQAAETTENQTEITEEGTVLQNDVLQAAEIPDNTKANEQYQKTGEYLVKTAKDKTLTVNSIGGEWSVIGLVRSGQNVDQKVYETYLNNLEQVLKKKNGVLHSKKYTEYSRVVLALTSLGEDVTDFRGYNLLEPLADFDQVVWQGINGASWALIAIDSHNYEIPAAKSGKKQTTREALINHLLENEKNGGGWALGSGNADVDITAMVIQSLAPYYDSNDKVKAAVDRGLKKLSTMQKNNGDFGTTYGGKTENTSESCSQVLVALSALKIDPETDRRFIKNGKSVLDALLSYKKGQGFSHVAGGDQNGMATEQAYYALASYERFKNGKTSLYNMSDIEVPEPTITPRPTPDPSKPTVTPEPTGAPNPTGGPKPTAAPKPTVTPKPTPTQKASKKPTGSTKTVTLTNGTSSDNSKDAKKKATDKNDKTKELSSKNINGSTEAAGKSKQKNEKKANDSRGTTTGEETLLTFKDSPNVLARKYTNRARNLAKAMGTLYIDQGNRKALFADEDVSDRKLLEQMKQIWDSYELLTESEKEAISSHARFENFSSNIERLRAKNHYDEDTTISVRDNEEAQLPWYVQLRVVPELPDSTMEQNLQMILGEQSKVLHLWDIQMYDPIQDKSWEPQEIIHLQIPMEPMGDYDQIIVVHITQDGTFEFLDSESQGEVIHTDTVGFSRYATVGIHGSIENLLEPVNTKNNTLLWILGCGGAAAILLIILIAVRKKI
ncbi:MAG: hypothetical protein Q4B47_03330 [Eubacteriales bacterium]|nr:hypothetical protein [Eubacteriales bacterium]